MVYNSSKSISQWRARGLSGGWALGGLVMMVTNGAMTLPVGEACHYCEAAVHPAMRVAAAPWPRVSGPSTTAPPV